MSRKTAETPRVTRKHVALARQERRATTAILVASGVLLIALLTLLGLGIGERLGITGRPAVSVNGDPISRAELTARTSLRRANLLQQRQQAVDLMGLFAGNPDIRQSLQQQVSQIDAQVNDTATLSSNTLQSLIQARLIRQEAQKRGIEVTQGDIDAAIREAFGFYPDGTPTASPTPTIDATLTAQVPPTATLQPTKAGTGTATSAPTGTATLPPVTPTSVTPTTTPAGSPTPVPTSTVYTLEAFQAEYRSYVDNAKKDLGVSEKYLRDQFADNLYQQRLLESFTADVAPTEEQVHAKHILVADQAIAEGLLTQVQQGASWDDLAAKNSLDTSNKDQGGDLGWFGPGVMVPPFEEAAFSGAVGQIVGPVESPFGWHLIWILDRKQVKLSPAAISDAATRAFQNWLTSAIQSATIDYDPALFPPTATVTMTVTEAAATPNVTTTP
jgi:peptidyl-prolyl cis-trans isomerase D